MSASDAAPLPRLGEVFFDVRGDSRTMRLSWYADTGIAVFSIWHGGTCTGTFRLPIADLPRMVEALRDGPEGDPLREEGAQSGQVAPARGQHWSPQGADDEVETGQTAVTRAYRPAALGGDPLGADPLGAGPLGPGTASRAPAGTGPMTSGPPGTGPMAAGAPGMGQAGPGPLPGDRGDQRWGDPRDQATRVYPGPASHAEPSPPRGRSAEDVPSDPEARYGDGDGYQDDPLSGGRGQRRRETRPRTRRGQPAGRPGPAEDEFRAREFPGGDSPGEQFRDSQRRGRERREAGFPEAGRGPDYRDLDQGDRDPGFRDPDFREPGFGDPGYGDEQYPDAEYRDAASRHRELPGPEPRARDPREELRGQGRRRRGRSDERPGEGPRPGRGGRPGSGQDGVGFGSQDGAGYPDHGSPDPSYAGLGYPETGNPDPGYPEAGYPEAGNPARPGSARGPGSASGPGYPDGPGYRDRPGSPGAAPDASRRRRGDVPGDPGYHDDPLGTGSRRGLRDEFPEELTAAGFPERRHPEPWPEGEPLVRPYVATPSDSGDGPERWEAEPPARSRRQNEPPPDSFPYGPPPGGRKQSQRGRPPSAD